MFLPRWERRTLPEWSRAVTGLLAWLVLLSMSGILVGVLRPVIKLFTEPTTETGWELAFIALGSSLVFKYASANPELFDFPHMKFFIRSALAFESPRLKKENIFEELDSHTVRRIYRETTGRNLKASDIKVEDDPVLRKIASEALHDAESRASDGKRQKAFKEDNVIRSDQRHMKKMLETPPQSPHLKAELRQLSQGQRVSITDSWKINSLRKAPHELYRAVTECTIDAPHQRMMLTIVTDTITRKHLATPSLLLRAKQDLYDFFQIVHQQDWMQPYLKFVKIIECICSEPFDDPFTGLKTVPLMKVEITTDVLLQYRNRFYNAAELATTFLSPSSEQEQNTA
jgi:hypothetical protein